MRRKDSNLAFKNYKDQDLPEKSIQEIESQKFKIFKRKSSPSGLSFFLASVMSVVCLIAFNAPIFNYFSLSGPSELNNKLDSEEHKDSLIRSNKHSYDGSFDGAVQAPKWIPDLMFSILDFLVLCLIFMNPIVFLKMLPRLILWIWLNSGDRGSRRGGGNGSGKKWSGGGGGFSGGGASGKW